MFRVIWDISDITMGGCLCNGPYFINLLIFCLSKIFTVERTYSYYICKTKNKYITANSTKIKARVGFKV